MSDLTRYNFTDDHGHPLENCREYIAMQQQLAIAVTALKEIEWSDELAQHVAADALKDIGEG